MNRPGLKVAVIGAGKIGTKRVEALAPQDKLLACCDLDRGLARELAERHSCTACETVDELLDLAPEVVVIATIHDQLAALAERALQAGADVLVEKPAGVSSAEIDRLSEQQRQHGRLVKVGFNHRFHPAVARAVGEVHSGRHGELLHLRARYGHGGRPGYEREWRAQRERSGGGELVDQGMHLLDLSNWLAGPLPLHSALLRTQFWDMEVEDNAALLLADGETRGGVFSMLHLSWTEWKNMFSLEIYCRKAKIQVDGLVRSYGPQRLQIYRMDERLGPPALEEVHFPEQDLSWQHEWEHFAAAVLADDGRALCGDLAGAHYAWTQIEAAYARSPFALTAESRG